MAGMSIRLKKPRTNHAVAAIQAVGMKGTAMINKLAGREVKTMTLTIPNRLDSLAATHREMADST